MIARVLCFLLALILASGAEAAAPTFKAVIGSTTEAASGASTDTTVSITVQAATNPLILAFSCFRDTGLTSQVVSSVVYNTSENFTLLQGGENTGNSNMQRCEIWQSTTASVGTHNIVATYSEAVQSASLVVIEYQDVISLGTPATVVISNNGTPVTIDLATTQANSLAIALLRATSSTSSQTFTVVGSNVERSDVVSGSTTNDLAATVVDQPAVTATTYTMASTPSQTSGRTIAMAVELKGPVPPSGSGLTLLGAGN